MHYNMLKKKKIGKNTDFICIKTFFVEGSMEDDYPMEKCVQNKINSRENTKLKRYHLFGTHSPIRAWGLGS